MTLRLSALALAILAPFAFPWQMSACVALATGFVMPGLPLLTGVLMDTLSYARTGAPLPWWTLFGALLAGALLLVRRRMKTDTMGA